MRALFPVSSVTTLALCFKARNAARFFIFSLDFVTDNDKRVAVARIKTYQQAYIWSLVLQSVNVPHFLEKLQDCWLITVAEQFRSAAVGHIASFEQENRNWPPAREEPVGLFSFRERRPPTLLLMGVLMIFYRVTGPWEDGSRWFLSGAVDLRQIIDHNHWWRLVTGLTLHADSVHLLGNVIIGGIVMHFLCKILGSGLSCFLVLVAGTAGNGFNIMLRTGQHLSVGFSTAVFGAIGVLTGLELKRQFRLKGILLPLGAGLSLLAMLGSSGERTDLGAHFWGLFAGCCIGIFVAFCPAFLKWCNAWQCQLLFWALFFLIIVGCWQLAFL